MSDLPMEISFISSDEDNGNESDESDDGFSVPAFMKSLEPPKKKFRKSDEFEESPYPSLPPTPEPEAEPEKITLLTEESTKLVPNPFHKRQKRVSEDSEVQILTPATTPEPSTPTSPFLPPTPEKAEESTTSLEAIHPTSEESQDPISTPAIATESSDKSAVTSPNR